MAQCQGFKVKTGKPCGATCPDGATHCYNHDPAHQEQRRLDGAKRGVDDLLKLEGQQRYLAGVVYELLNDKECDPRRLTACVRGIEVLSRQTLLLEERAAIRNGERTAAQTKGSQPTGQTILEILGRPATAPAPTDQTH